MAAISITPLESWMAAKLSNAGFIDMKQYQLDRLQTLIEYARNVSPFYREHLHGMSVPETLQQFSSYPLLSAAELSKQGLRMLCVSQSEISRVVTLTTSGTQGDPKKVYFTSEDQELTIDFFACGMSSLVGKGDRVLIFLPGERQGSVGDLLYKGLRRIEVDPIPYGFVDTLQRAVMAMCQVKPTCLVGVPVQLLAMARLWEKWKNASWKPRSLLLSTDCVPSSIISELKRIWDCEVFDHYGMTEMGLGGGIECAAHDGYHLRETDLYVEIVDEHSGQSLPTGQYGEVVFTTLTRRGMPLIRYRTGDISRFIPQVCTCGSVHRRLEKIKTRKDRVVDFGENRILTLSDLDAVLFILPGIINFTAEVCVAEVVKLRLTVMVLDEVPIVQKEILEAIRKVTVLRLMEKSRKLVVELNTRTWDKNAPLIPGKRCLKITKSV